MPPVLRVENLSKTYLLNHRKNTGYRSIREEFMGGIKNAFSIKNKKNEGDSKELFWALKNITFDVKQGERVAIIGRNGAGKSTLLKLLSRVTKPSQGKIEINGRLSSLLEVGTGFHPELSGLENIYLNGAILGLTRKEVRQKFDEIVAFAEIEKFLDTPVKRYSSGMYVRLAFSVAAHLEPDILLVDEVLAVGDIQFQKKCLGKIREVSNNGRTILLVSHNLAVLQSICEKGLVIDAGTSSGVKPINEALSSYKNLLGESRESQMEWVNDTFSLKYAHDVATPLRCALQQENSTELVPNFTYLDKVKFEVDLDVHIRSEELTIGYAIYDASENLLFWSFNVDVSFGMQELIKEGHNRFECDVPLGIFNEGEYKLKLLLGIYNREWLIGPNDNGPSLSFSVEGVLSSSPYWIIKRPGLIAPRLSWTHKT